MNPVYSILGFEVRLNWLELHHGYYGVALMLISLVMAFTPEIWGIYNSIYVFSVGAYLFIDDIYQHHRQVDEPFYHSPVHNTFRFLYVWG